MFARTSGALEVVANAVTMTAIDDLEHRTPLITAACTVLAWWVDSSGMCISG